MLILFPGDKSLEHTDFFPDQRLADAKAAQDLDFESRKAEIKWK